MEDTAGTVDPHAADNDTTTVVAGAPGGGGQVSVTAPDFKATDDGNIVEYGGKKYYREEAVHAERTRASNYAKTLQTLEPLMPEFEEFLKQKQGGERAAVGRATRNTASSGEYTEDELNGYAITRGYYDKDNKPDLNRAKDDLDIMTAIAARQAGRAVKPVADQTAADRARQNTERAMGQRFVDGEPIADDKYMQAAFNSLPEEMKADPQVTNLLSVVAAGLQALDDRRQGRARGGRREPVFREGSGDRFDSNTDSLDALDRAAARARGKSPEQWAKSIKAVSGGSATGGTVLDEV